MKAKPTGQSWEDKELEAFAVGVRAATETISKKLDYFQEKGKFPKVRVVKEFAEYIKILNRSWNLDTLAKESLSNPDNYFEKSLEGIIKAEREAAEKKVEERYKKVQLAAVELFANKLKRLEEPVEKVVPTHIIDQLVEEERNR